jgi:hypothetical protein
MKHVQEPLPLPGPEVVPEPMLRALLKAATKKPEDRWPSAGSFVDALASGLGAPAAVSAAPTVAIPRETPPAPATIVSPDGPARPERRHRCPAAGHAPPAVPSDVVAILPGGLVLRRPSGSRGAWPRRVRRGHLGRVAAPGPVIGVSSRWTGTLGRAGERDGRTASDASCRLSRSCAPADSLAPRPGRGTDESGPHAADATSAAGSHADARAGSRSQSDADAARRSAAGHPCRRPAVDPEVERLAAALSDRDAATRRRAAQDLSARGPLAAPAVPALVTALADRSPDVRLRAAEALGRIGPAAQAASTPLAEALDMDPLFRRGRQGPRPARGGAHWRRRTRPRHYKDVAVRRSGLALRGWAGTPSRLAALVAALSDKDRPSPQAAWA